MTVKKEGLEDMVISDADKNEAVRLRLRTNKVSVRVLFSEEDYLKLDRIAKLERTDISTLIRRAVARYFFVPDKSGAVKQWR